MKRHLQIKIVTLFPLIWIAAVSVQAQSLSYEQQIITHRNAYKAEFRASATSPLHSDNDLAMLRFFAPDIRYRVEATVQLTPAAEPFEMPTYSGKTQSYVKYATASFSLNDQPFTLAIFRSPIMMRLPQYRDYLFLPFKDATAGKETYGGGRYLDLRLGDIRDGKLMLDFNKAYNPYCAYADGYSCPIPPKENELPVAIEAGEKKFVKGH